VLGDRSEPLGIQGKEMLKTKDDIREQEPDQTEEKKGQGILLPGLLLSWVCS
jgi:hypothetical protein